MSGEGELHVLAGVARMTEGSPNAAGLGAFIDALREPGRDHMAHWARQVLAAKGVDPDVKIALLGQAFELWTGARLAGVFRS